MSKKAYSSAPALRQAVESRLLEKSRKESLDIMRLRRHFIFDRFLCRIFHGEKENVILKGGYAMELRVSAARTTRDIDLCMKKGRGHIPTPGELWDFFQEKASTDLGDFIAFSVLPQELELTNAPYGGYRFPVVASMAGRLFLKFSIDVAMGDIWLSDNEMLRTTDWLEFAGISAGEVPAISIEQQLAEKIHSYTLPRQNPNSRTKDLIDVILLVRNFNIKADRMREALEKTFKTRKTHALPDELPPPPQSWEKKFTLLADECGLKMNLAEAFDLLKEFYSSTAK